MEPIMKYGIREPTKREEKEISYTDLEDALNKVVEENIKLKLEVELLRIKLSKALNPEAV